MTCSRIAFAAACLVLPAAALGAGPVPTASPADAPAPPAAAAPLPAPDVLAARIDTYVAPFVERGHLSGRLFVAHGGQTIYDRSFGMADLELRVPNGRDIVYNVASITKPMTVTAFIGLSESKALAPDDPLSKWIPDFPRGDEITVMMLARHRAGIPHRVTDASEETVPRTAGEMVAFAERKPLISEPGETSIYSSAGFAVLARVLELAAHQSYGELMRRLVFEPAGMTRTTHADSRMLLPGRASSYVFDTDGRPVNVSLQDLSFLVGAGSVWSTADDLDALLRAVRAGRFGDGVRQSFVHDGGIAWNGVTNGFRAFADWHADSDVTVIYTGNLVSGAIDRVRRDVPRLAAGEAVEPEPPPAVAPVRVDEATLRSYEGTYQLRPGSPLEVRAIPGGLRVNDWVLVPTAERRFFSPQDYATVEIVLDDAGRPERLDWGIADGVMACPRIGDLPGDVEP